MLVLFDWLGVLGLVGSFLMTGDVGYLVRYPEEKHVHRSKMPHVIHTSVCF